MAMTSKLGICQWCLPGDEDAMCDHASDLGLQGIELNFYKDWKKHKWSDPREQKVLLRKSVDKGIEFPTLGLNVFCDFAMIKPENFETVKDIFQRALDIALSLGVQILQVPSFGVSSINTEREFDQTIKSFEFACKLVKDENILIGTENPLSWEENLRIINTISSDKMKIYFDTQNPHVLRGYDVPEMVGKLFPHICEVHAKDGDQGKMGSTPLGKGTASFERTMNELTGRSYTGWVILENDYSTNSQIRDDIKILSAIG
jgi:sugar phosphate isomerase/epimerase